MLARLSPSQIHWMGIQNGEALLHHLPQHRLLGQPRTDLGAQMVVRWLQEDQFSLFPYHNMPVAGAGIELNCLGIEGGADSIHQHIRVFCRNFTRAVVQNGLFRIGLLFGEGNNVGAENHVIRLHLYPNAERFQGRSTRVRSFGIVAQHGKIGYVRPGGHAAGHILHQPHVTHGCQGIHTGGLGILQRSLPAQSLQRLVGHSVT